MNFVPTPGSRVSRTSSIGLLLDSLRAARDGKTIRPIRRDSLMNTTPTTAVTRTNSPANGLTSSRNSASSAAPAAARSARMIVNSPRATRAEPTLTLCRRVKPVARPATNPATSLPPTATGTATASQSAASPACAEVDLQAEGEEEDRGGEVAQAEELLLDLVADLRPRQQDAGQQRADGLRQPAASPSAPPPIAIARAPSRSCSRSRRGPMRSKTWCAQRPTSRNATTNPSARPAVAATSSPPTDSPVGEGGRDAQEEGDRQVLEDEDARARGRSRRRPGGAGRTARA